jgi:hypothetical protein
MVAPRDAWAKILACEHANVLTAPPSSTKSPAGAPTPPTRAEAEQREAL